MYSFQIFNVFIIFFISFANLKAQSSDNDFIFPLDIPATVSGSFGELRSNHFHSGIDITTNGKTGYPVKSMHEGVVSRIKVSPYGYGNAVYIKHPNGYTTVYGHLKKYSRKIDSVITVAQYNNKSFSIDYFPNDSIFITRGEIIGFSGNSGGSGGPHLHYEIRDTKTEEPLNPYFFQSKISDNSKPKLITLRVYPIGEKSSVNGENKPKNFEIVYFDGKYHLKGRSSINASGNIGIGIRMIDYMSGSWRKCGVYKLNMKVNNQDYYSWALNRFSFYETRYINSHIDYFYYKEKGIRFERCFKQPNNKLSIYTNSLNNGIINVDSVKTIVITAEDAAKNKGVLEFKIIRENFSFKPNRDTLTNQKLPYYKANTISHAEVTCNIPAFSLYDDEFIEVTEISEEGELKKFKVGDETIPLHKNAEISYTIPDSLIGFGKQLALASNYKNKDFYAGGFLSGNKLILKTKQFGIYSLKVDTIAPTIKPLQNTKGASFTKNNKLKFTISDDFSNIKSYNGFINNNWTLFEYDAKTKRLTCSLAKAPLNGKGTYELKLVVEDNCSNQKVYTATFFII